MFRQLVWFLMGWEGPIPIDTYSTAEHVIAVTGALILVLLYPLWFRMCFAVSRRARYARVGAWTMAAVLGLSWYFLVLDVFQFNTFLIVGSAALIMLAAVAAYLYLNRV